MTDEYASERFWRTTWIHIAAARGEICIIDTCFGMKMAHCGRETTHNVAPVMKKWYAAKATWQLWKDISDRMYLLVNTLTGQVGI